MTNRLLQSLRGWLKARYRRWRDARTRRELAAMARRGGCFVLASTWEFPNPTHTFVHQEMLGLRQLATQLGLGVRILHGEARAAAPLAQRFAPLLGDTARIETIAAIHRADRDTLARAHPGRVDAFLQRVATATGRSVAALRDEPLVLRACTFTRLCELAGVRYLQTWFCYEESFLAMFAAAVLDVPRGLSCHVDHVLADHPFKLVALHLETADLVTAISERTRAELLAIGGAACAPRLLRKRIGVDGERLRPLRDLARAPFELLSVSRLEPKKGLAVLVEAAALLRARGRRVLVRIVGGEDRGHAASADCARQLRELVRVRGLDDVVRMPGAVPNDDLPSLLAAAGAFVAPYVTMPSGDVDGIPTSVVEAMAAGLPIVATAVGAIGEVVVDGQEGLLVPEHDAAALAAAIERLLDDGALRARLGAAAARRFDAEFDCRRSDEPLHERVRQLLAARPAST